MRRKIVAGNWKMNKSASEAVKFVEALKGLVADAESEVIVGVPFVCLPGVVAALDGTNVKVAAQNMHWEEKGAYTGEISGGMLADLQIKYVIIGHSERRQYFNETDETVNLKTKAALSYGLRPIICVGESLEQRKQGKTVYEELVKDQVTKALAGVTSVQMSKVVIAYEPIWAIGTGETATNEQANEVCALIRQTIKALYNAEVAEQVKIQYGGSVNEKNAADLFAMSDIDGGLVGGASLKEAAFEVIVKA